MNKFEEAYKRLYYGIRERQEQYGKMLAPLVNQQSDMKRMKPFLDSELLALDEIEKSIRSVQACISEQNKIFNMLVTINEELDIKL